MPETATIDGNLIALTARAYEPWTDDKGAQRPAGTTYQAWIATDFDQAPTMVKVPAALVSDFRDAGYHAQVRVRVDLYARGNRLERVASQVAVGELAS